MQPLGRYAREAAFAWKSGEDWASRLGLTARTLAFHGLNALRSRPAARDPHPYRLRLLDRPATVWLRTAGGDLFIFYEIFFNCEYDLPDPQIAGRPLKIVDLGANVGLASLYYHLKFPGSQFFCVEPEPSNLEILRKNLGGLPNVRVLAGAVGATSGKAAFDASGASWGGQLSATGSFTVDVHSLDNVIERSGFKEVDLLKIDIEGAERDLFRARPRSLERVRRIVIEVHPPYTFEEFRDDAALCGFKAYLPGQAPFPNRMIVALR